MCSKIVLVFLILFKLASCEEVPDEHDFFGNVLKTQRINLFPPEIELLEDKDENIVFNPLDGLTREQILSLQVARGSGQLEESPLRILFMGKVIFF